MLRVLPQHGDARAFAQWRFDARHAAQYAKHTKCACTREPTSAAAIEHDTEEPGELTGSSAETLSLAETYPKVQGSSVER